MSKSPYSSREFQKLQKRAYKQLKEDGFKDLESDTERRSGRLNRQYVEVDFLQADFLQKCSEYWANNELPPPRHFIFGLFSSGVSERAIEEALKMQESLPTYSRPTINREINRILRDAGIERPPKVSSPPPKANTKKGPKMAKSRISAAELYERLKSRPAYKRSAYNETKYPATQDEWLRYIEAGGTIKAFRNGELIKYRPRIEDIYISPPKAMPVEITAPKAKASAPKPANPMVEIFEEVGA